ncbi:MAG: sensor histidine kinase, partial [Bacteroidota bacterium]
KDAAREVLMNKGVALEKMEKFAQAEELYQGIVKDIQAIQPQNANVEQEMGNVYNNLGIALFRQKKYEEAHGQFDRAYELQLRNDRTLAQMEVLNNLSMNRCAQGRFGEALEYATQVEAVVAENDIPEVEVELYRNLSDIYEGLGNSQQALSYHRKFVTLHEALLSDETIRLLAGFELEFERFLSEKEFLTQEKILAQEKFTNLLLWSGLAAAILLAILFFLGLRTNQQKRKALQVEIEHKQLANQQIILDLLHDHEVESLNAMLEGQEIERERISSELHDSLGGTLAAAKISLITLQKKLNGQDEPAYDKTEHLIDVATQEMRRISHDLAGKTLRDGGLVPALEELTSIFTHDAPFQVQLDVTGLAEGDRIDRNIEINLYRMVQELFQNIVKHAQASEVKITLNRLGDRVHMQVEDDGVGFTYDPEQASSGLGLASLKARAEKFGGSLMVKTAPGAGTMTRVQVPLV